MKNVARFFALASLSVLTLSCVDENYDLSDIDTTMQVEVNDLTLPLNLSPVTFGALVDIEDEENIKINQDGEYCIYTSGDFDEVVSLDKITTHPSYSSKLVNQQIAYFDGLSIALDKVDFPIFFSNKISMQKYIVNIESGKVDFDISFYVSISDNSGNLLKFDLSDFALQIPSGFYGWYESPDGTKGQLSAENSTATFKGTAKPGKDNKYEFTIHINEIDVTNCSGADIDYNIGLFKINDNLQVAGGNIKIENSSYTTPVSANLNMDLLLDTMEIKSVTATIEYSLDEFDTQHISLDGLPDELLSEDNRIRLVNPQLYLSVVNPMGTYGFIGSAGVQITQERSEGEAVYSATLDERLTIASVDGVQNFVICPRPELLSSNYEGFENAKSLKMTGLGDILYGDGIPEGLAIDIQSPRLERNRVVDFELGKEYGSVAIHYEFCAPIALAENSQIVYSDIQTGWEIDDENNLEISKLSIAADLKSEIPVALSLTAYPTDEDGNVLKDLELVVSPEVIPANYQGELKIELKGTILELHGMQYTIKVLAEKDCGAITPDQQVVINNIRATVSGKYIITEEDDDDEYYYYY